MPPSLVIGGAAKRGVKMEERTSLWATGEIRASCGKSLYSPMRKTYCLIRTPRVNEEQQGPGIKGDIIRTCFLADIPFRGVLHTMQYLTCWNFLSGLFCVSISVQETHFYGSKEPAMIRHSGAMKRHSIKQICLPLAFTCKPEINLTLLVLQSPPVVVSGV